MPNLFHWMLACLLPTHLGDTPSSAPSNAQNPFLLLVQVPTQIPLLSVLPYLGRLFPWGCPQGTVVQMWPWEGGESTGYPMRCRAGRHVWNLQACLYLRFKQQHHIASASSAQGRQAAGFYKGLGFDSSPEPHANVNSREPAPGPRNPETLSGW